MVDERTRATSDSRHGVIAMWFHRAFASFRRGLARFVCGFVPPRAPAGHLAGTLNAITDSGLNHGREESYERKGDQQASEALSPGAAHCRPQDAVAAAGG